MIDMYIDNVRVAGGELILETKDHAAARRFAYDFKKGEYDIKRTRKKRSLNANNYCWELCTRIGEAVGIPKEEVYRRSIRDVGAYTPMPIKTEGVDKFSDIWQQRGVGWFVDVIDDSKHEGYKLIFAYHGSSLYDTAEMSRLIDNLIQDAKAVGVEVISESEKALLMQEWNNGEIKKNKGT